MFWNGKLQIMVGGFHTTLIFTLDANIGYRYNKGWYSTGPWSWMTDNILTIQPNLIRYFDQISGIYWDIGTKNCACGTKDTLLQLCHSAWLLLCPHPFPVLLYSVCCGGAKATLMNCQSHKPEHRVDRDRYLLVSNYYTCGVSCHGPCRGHVGGHGYCKHQVNHLDNKHGGNYKLGTRVETFYSVVGCQEMIWGSSSQLGYVEWDAVLGTKTLVGVYKIVWKQFLKCWTITIKRYYTGE